MDDVVFENGWVNLVELPITPGDPVEVVMPVAPTVFIPLPAGGGLSEYSSPFV